MRLSLLLISLNFALISSSQSIVGKWKTIDDNTNHERSVVEIYENGGKFYGKVLKTYPKPDEDPDPVCNECEDHRKGQKIIGMEIISDMQYSSKSGLYQKGEILDPENGNIYDCRLWLAEDGSLKVRGYLLFFYRTQTWFPWTGE
ncbi:MAG: DUF2147 domain-containing protein [Cyclobacteriaceae bacterium]